jgi:hypothetical protein
MMLSFDIVFLMYQSPIGLFIELAFSKVNLIPLLIIKLIAYINLLSISKSRLITSEETSLSGALHRHRGIGPARMISMINLTYFIQASVPS